MFNKVQFVTGLLCGVVFPAITWLFFDVLFKGITVFYNPSIPYLISIAVNLFILRYFIKKENITAAGAVMIMTFVFTMAIFMIKLKI